MAIKTVLNFKTAGDGWSVDVLKCVAKDGEGIDRIATLIERHRKFLHTGNRLKKKRGERARARVYELVAERLRDAFWGPEKKKLLDRNLEAIVGLSMSPYECADLLLKNRRK
jgi:putative protein kinase ArgK-like GTPase of G3E family